MASRPGHVESQTSHAQDLSSWPHGQLLRWEATDLYAYILESERLSVVRGASVLLELFCSLVG